MSHRYAHLPPPPTPVTHLALRDGMSFYRARRTQAFDAVEEHAVYAWRTVDAGGQQNVEVIGLTDYLWRAVQMHCGFACHTLHLSLRGAWKYIGCVRENDFHQATVELGDHSGRQIIVQHTDWSDFVQELCIKLMPGWWNPPPTAAPLIFTGGIPKELIPIAKAISALKPGACLFVPDGGLFLPSADIMQAITQRTPMDSILESLVGSAYEITAKRQTGFLEKPGYLVRRLKRPIPQEYGDRVRAYLSPDRRTGWTQCPETGLWDRIQ